MKIGLYIETGVGNGVGGAELMMAHLASEWAGSHSVDLIHHRPPLTRDRLTEFSTDDYSRITMRYVPRAPEPVAAGDPFRRYQASREWHASLSRGYDLFVNCTHWLPPFCHATTGALLILYPFFIRPYELPEIQTLPAWRRLRYRLYYEFEWRRRLASYQHAFAISEFARQGTRRRWGLDPAVVYPPVDTDFADGPKEPLIVSISRFNVRARKKQLEMMRAYSEMNAAGLRGWHYASVGGLNSTPANHEFFEAVRQAGAGCPMSVESNLGRASLKALLQRSRIFWHAMGLDEDTDRYPERAEHFGIVTVEAMAAGCVPVVINKGGQPEIVEHGRTGFVWNTVDQLKSYTRLLTEDRALWQRMSVAARERAQLFRRERFVREMSERCGVAEGRAGRSSQAA